MPPNPRYIPLYEDECVRLDLIREHEGNDLSTNDAALLASLVSRYEKAEGDLLSRALREIRSKHGDLALAPGMECICEFCNPPEGVADADPA